MYKITEDINIGSIITLKKDIDTLEDAKMELDNIVASLPSAFNKTSYKEKLKIIKYN